MSSVPSVPGVEIDPSWPGGCERVLTAVPLELLAVLHRMFGPPAVETVDAAIQATAPPSGAAIRPGPSVLVIELYGPQVVATAQARMGEPMPVACTVQVLDAPVQVGSAGRHLATRWTDPADEVRHGTWMAALTHWPFSRREYVDARRLPAGL
jgi:hypothetical protein